MLHTCNVVMTLQIEDVEWSEVPHTNLVGGHVPVSIGSHFLHHTNPAIKFGIAIYGWDRHDSYGYSGGLQVRWSTANQNMPNMRLQNLLTFGSILY